MAQSLLQLAKIRVFKVDYFSLPLFWVPKLRLVAQNEWKKHPYIIFSTFGSKINEFVRKKSEKTKKIQKLHNPTDIRTYICTIT
jgi:hypothetical protein